MTRGHRGSLLLRCRAFSSPSPCRFIPAHQIGGYPAGSITEIFDIPMTAHFLGGCTIGDSATTGVIDPYHRVHGHPGLHVVDGSAISPNLGVNPSLTITAQAERAMSFWPNKGEEDPRPPVVAGYRRLKPVPPRSPVVPPQPPAPNGRRYTAHHRIGGRQARGQPADPPPSRTRRAGAGGE